MSLSITSIILLDSESKSFLLESESVHLDSDATRYQNKLDVFQSMEGIYLACLVGCIVSLLFLESTGICAYAYGGIDH